MLAAAVTAVVERPQLRSLVLRVPLAELVAEGEHPLLGARLLLVPPRAAEDRVVLPRLDRVEQHRGLQLVAHRARSVLLHDAAVVDGFLDAADDEGGAQLVDAAVAVLEHLRESCGRCRRAAPGTGSWRARTPSPPAAASRSSPCRRRTAGPGARTRLPPRGRCGSTRIRASADASAHSGALTLRLLSLSRHRSVGTVETNV